MAKANINTQELVVHQFDGGVINLRNIDGYVSATQMCKLAGKKVNHYKDNDSTNEYLDALSEDLGVPVKQLFQVVRGGSPSIQGTWVHPKVAIHLAQWLSPKFAVQVSNWVHDWMTTKVTPTFPAMVGGKVAKAQIVLYYQNGDVKTKAFTEANINSACKDLLPKCVMMNRDQVLSAIDPIHKMLKQGMGLVTGISEKMDGKEGAA